MQNCLLNEWILVNKLKIEKCVLVKTRQHACNIFNLCLLINLFKTKLGMCHITRHDFTMRVIQKLCWQQEMGTMSSNYQILSTPKVRNWYYIQSVQIFCRLLYFLQILTYHITLNNAPPWIVSPFLKKLISEKRNIIQIFALFKLQIVESQNQIHNHILAAKEKKNQTNKPWVVLL